MKKQTRFNSLILFFIMTISVFFGLVSCNGMTQQRNLEDDKVILRFSVTGAERTVLPENPKLEDLEDIRFSYSNIYAHDSFIQTKEYNNMQEFLNDPIILNKSEIGSYYSFELQCTTGNISYYDFIKEYQIQAGENVLDFSLRRNNLGKNKGSVDITIDFSGAANCDDVDHVDVSITPVRNSSDNSIQSFESVFNKESADSKKVIFKSSSILAGTYEATVNFYATSNSNALMLSYPFILQVAENLTSRGNLTVNQLNPAYNITFDMNAKNDTNIIFDYDANSKMTRLSKTKPDEPLREGYVFAGWERQYADGWWYLFTDYNVTSDITLRATWVQASTSDGTYLATKETVSKIIAGIDEGTKYNPAKVQLIGVLDGETIDNIRLALQANPDVYFEIDLSSVSAAEDNTIDSTNNFYNCKNLVTIDLTPQYFPETNIFKGCTSLSNIVRKDNDGGWPLVIDNVLFAYGLLICYPAGLEGDSYEIPDGLNDAYGIADDAFSGSSLKTITIPASCENISPYSFNNSAKLETIIVSDDNPKFKSVDGVLYSKDGKELIYYPSNKQGGAFEIPEQVTVIEPNSFLNALNLQKVTFDDSDALWYKDKADKIDLINIIAMSERIDTSDSVTNATILKNNDQYYLYKVQLDKLLSQSNILKVYDESCYDLEDNSFTIYEYSTANPNNYVFYKVPTQSGKVYIITDNQAVINSKQSKLHGIDLSSKYEIYLISDEGDGIPYENGQDGKEFTARSDYSYILLRCDSFGSYVIRVMTVDVITKDISVDIENENTDIVINVNEWNMDGEDYIGFNIDMQNLGDYYCTFDYTWYIDGNRIQNVTEGYLTLRKSDYMGIHLITFEEKIQREQNSSPVYYSASKQVFIN
ncbi:MAG: leucine-rich repeat protein [Treponema sp.]|nr:leucine-rich repeat protein [Treponema sp.]